MLNIGVRLGVVNATTRPLYPGKDPIPIVEKGGWNSEPVWTGVEKRKFIVPTEV
jgi:hypothetical protein